ncbi:hypothetical protein Q3A66_18990 [Hymenobacter sp. BT770]|uniref:hypothetical protein n=1 Tax=Hymenobacter sp. BT770 TaxID=2886942 RepID=UPI001D1048F5|nr:hypothetical protein [Hymenobacter sp. BT770]MCC3155204.1 hypothetical protein [Hymenobacter sp. BT770]MDO3417159.1 hypothetical protein [Hymenobacter sp. BT770]
MTYSIKDFTILSTGNDGGHHYLYTYIDHHGQRRKLVVFFADKADERKMRTATKVTVTGTLTDEGPQHSLHLSEAVLLAWE